MKTSAPRNVARILQSRRTPPPAATSDTNNLTYGASSQLTVRKLIADTVLALKLDCSSATLRGWRVAGIGPPYIRLSSRMIRYDEAVVDAWIAARQRRSTSQGDK